METTPTFFLKSSADRCAINLVAKRSSTREAVANENMKTLVNIFLLSVLLNFTRASKDIVCEYFSDGYGGRECYLKVTVIDSEDYAFNEVDNTIKSLQMRNNKKIQILPAFVSRQLPAMLLYDATNCSLTIIARKHFQGLSELNQLHLAENMIETIPSDTFQDLVKCTQIGLNRNRIKSMNGRLFENLPRLTRIMLEGNECIDEYIQGYDPIRRSVARIDRQCGFIESAATSISCESISPRRYRKCCFMNNATTIDTTNSSFSGSRDDSVREINCSRNKKIFFLPIRVTDKYPDLRSYEAAECSLTTITKENFERMTNLKYLDLIGNQIETIFSNTFEDLLSLNYLRIGRFRCFICEPASFMT